MNRAEKMTTDRISHGYYFAAQAQYSGKVAAIECQPEHLNAANAEWQKTLLEYRSKYNTNVDLAYLLAFRTMQMLSLAINGANSTDPTQVAYALEGLRLQGPSGEAWMRAEDHQLIAPIYIMSFAKAGGADVKHDTEDTGFGWKTESIIDGKENIPPVKCRMERPSRSLPAK
jgi:branched-chain amino acid transport system substrate-binding protein